MARKENRNAQGAGSIRQRKDGTWEARYTAGRDPGTGKQRQKSVYAKTQKEVLQKLQQVQNDLNNGTYVEPSKMTLSSWLDIWTQEYPGDIKERTLNEYKGQIEYRIKPALGAVKLSELDTHTLQKFYNNCMRGSKSRKPISPKTTKNLHGVLHKAMEQAVDLGYIRVNPATKCKLPRAEKPDIKPLDDNQIAAFLQEVHGHRFEMIYVIDLFTGMRQGEILGLPWESIDFEANTITIEHTVTMAMVDMKRTLIASDTVKTKSSYRTLPLVPSFRAKLLEVKAEQEQYRKVCGNSYNKEESKYIYTDPLGNRIRPDYLTTAFPRFMVDHGFRRLRFHDLRHSCASLLLASGVPLKQIQEWLGHSDFGITANTYAHLEYSSKLTSANAMTWIEKTSLMQGVETEADKEPALEDTQGYVSIQALPDMLNSLLVSGVPVNVIQAWLKQDSLNSPDDLMESFRKFAHSYGVENNANCQPMMT